MGQDQRQTLRITTELPLEWTGFDTFPTLHELHTEFGKNPNAVSFAALDQQIRSAIQAVDDWSVSHALTLLADKCERLTNMVRLNETDNSATPHPPWSVRLSVGGLDFLDGHEPDLPDHPFIGLILKLPEGQHVWLCASLAATGRLRFEQIFGDGERVLSRYILSQSACETQSPELV